MPDEFDIKFSVRGASGDWVLPGRSWGSDGRKGDKIVAAAGQTTRKPVRGSSRLCRFSRRRFLSQVLHPKGIFTLPREHWEIRRLESRKQGMECRSTRAILVPLGGGP